jgi:hypothetical protein
MSSGRFLASNTSLIAIFAVTLFLASILIFYFSPAYAPKILSAAAGPFDLSKVTTIVQETDSRAFYSDSNATFSAFVYLNPINRTGTYGACGSNSNQASCDDGTFAPCPCSAVGDCSVCDHSGYNTVFNISGIVDLEVLIAPDASRQGKAITQLLVKTEGAALNSGMDQPTRYGPAQGSPAGGSPRPTPVPAQSQKYIETLSLPPLPVQKWTFVSVSREGRRFDVYYNDTLVLSQKTMSMPISNVSNSSMGGITSGSTGLQGQLAIANLYNYRMSSKDVSSMYAKYADTRGRPYLNTVSNPTALSDLGGLFPAYASTLSYNLTGYIPSFSLCPSGGCFSPPTIQPANPLYDWSTQY